MARVVLVHGIGQEQKSADTLETSWRPNMAGGLRIAGYHQEAEAMSAGANRTDVRMAFYGDLFLGTDVQGADEELEDLDGDPLATALALEWLEEAAVHASHPGDRREAARQLAAADSTRIDIQGARAVLRPALNGLAQLRWFMSLGAAVAERLVFRTLSQVTRYFTDDTLRAEAIRRTTELIDSDTALVVGHSLGSVVAYEALHQSSHRVPHLVTLGSPLGLRTVIYERLRPQPPAVPADLRRWTNVADLDDLVAARPDLSSQFPGAPGVLSTATLVDNGSQPHNAEYYLTKKATGDAIGMALNEHS
jgi:hypothetical protein